MVIRRATARRSSRRTKTKIVVIWLAILGMRAGAALAQEISVAAGYDVAGWLRRDEPIELELDRQPAAGEGRLAVLVGTADLTDLFRTSERGLIYRPDLLPLPAGEREVEVYLVSPQGEWREVARLPLRVLQRGGFERSESTPRLDLQSLALFDRDLEGGETGFRDATGQLDFRGAVARRGWGVRGGLNVVGVTEISQALRFGERGDAAPKADLSSYTLSLERGRRRFELGHVTFGASRHLIQGFGSRGATVSLPLGSAGEFGFGAMSGTSIVGWDNILGLAENDHQVLAGRLGFELLPGRPGAVRFEGTLLDGTLLPRSDFTQAEVTDREENRGWSLLLSTRAWADRFRAEGGYGESAYHNPFDPLLAQGDALVPVEEETRGARYLDLALDLLRNRAVTDRLPLSLTLGYRHERVDPLYRSVASFVQADVESDGVDLTASLGPVSAQVGWSDAEDNLDDIPSILKTKTRRRGGNLAIPLGQLGGGDDGGRRGLPLLTYAVDRTHQFGAGIPVDSGFSASHVPDQVSLNHAGGLEWQGNRWRLGYRLGQSDQDNRQPGRERADFTNLIHGIALGHAPHRRLDLNFDLSSEKASNQELDEMARTERYGVGFVLRVTEWLTLTGGASRTEGETEPVARESEATIADLQAAFRLRLVGGERHGIAAQPYVRYAYQDTASRDLQFGFASDVDSWSINSGISLSFY